MFSSVCFSENREKRGSFSGFSRASWFLENFPSRGKVVPVAVLSLEKKIGRARKPAKVGEKEGRMTIYMCFRKAGLSTVESALNPAIKTRTRCRNLKRWTR